MLFLDMPDSRFERLVENVSSDNSLIILIIVLAAIIVAAVIICSVIIKNRKKDKGNENADVKRSETPNTEASEAETDKSNDI